LPLKHIFGKIIYVQNKMSMKSIKHIVLAAFVTLGVFSAVLYTSCTKDACKDVTCNNGGTCSGGNCTCVTGYFGTSCDSVYRNGYVGTYKGNGVDNGTPPNTYTGYYMVFTNVGSSVTAMQMVLQTNTTAPFVSVPITLTTIASTSSVFTITSTSAGGYTYTGTGTVSNSIASLVLTETDNITSAVTTYTFTNMARQ